MASKAMAASKQPQRSYDIRFDISNLDYPGIHAHIASNNHFGGLWGHGGLQMTLEVKIEMSNLNYHGIHVHIASDGHLGVLRGHAGLQMTSEVKADLKI